MAISLDKRSALAEVSLVKALTKAAKDGIDLGEVKAQVILVFDYSGSMSAFYRSGEVQELTERVLGLALPLDDDGTIQVFPFDHRAHESFTVNAGNYAGIVDDWRFQLGQFAPAPVTTGLFKRKVQPSGSERGMGGTEYSVAIDKVLDFAREEGMLDPGQPPVLVLFQSDGGTGNPEGVKRLLTDAASLPIFWMFLGLGNNTGFLDVLNNMPGRVVDNVGAVGVASIKGTPDEEFYDKVTDEFVTKWIPEARRLGILKDQP